MLFYFLALVFASFASAKEDSGHLNEQNERILAIQLQDGTEIADAIIAYQVGKNYYLPLRAMSEALAFSIGVSTDTETAEGFYISEENNFYLNIKSCTLRIRGKNTPINCSLIIKKDNDFFLPSNMLSSWFSLELNVLPFKSLVIINSAEPLPIEQKKERNLRSKNLLVGHRKKKHLPPAAPSNGWLSGPMIDEQLRLSYGKYSSGIEIQHDSLVSAKVLGLEFESQLQGSEKKISSPRITIAKHDKSGTLLPLGITEIQTVDIDYPAMELINQAQTMRGILVSNTPLGSTSQFSTQDFEGPLPQGWELELYQNNQLIERREADASGRYRINDVPLLYGRNEFQFIFYGPQGQRKSSFQTYNVDQSFHEGKNLYFTAAIAKKKKLFPQITPPSSENIHLQMEKNISEKIMGQVTYSRANKPSDYSQANYFSAKASGFMNIATWSTIFSKDMQGGHIFNGILKTGTGLLNLSLSHSEGRSFESEAIPLNANLSSLRSKSRAELSFPLPFIDNFLQRIEAESLRYEDRSKKNKLSLWTATKIKKLFLNNLLTLNSEEANPNGTLGVLASLSPFNLRGDLSYNNKLTAWSTELEYAFSRKLLARWKISQDIAAHLIRHTIGLTKEFSFLSLTANAIYDNRNSFSTQAYLSFSLAHDENGSGTHMLYTPQAKSGAVSIRVFQDKNQNGIFDTNDIPMENVEVLVDGRQGNYLSNREGRIYISALPSFEESNISLVIGSLKNPLLSPTSAGFSVMPTPGANQELLFPIHSTWQIDGVVEFTKGNAQTYQKGVALELQDAAGIVLQSTQTDEGGSYFFENVSPGEKCIKLPNYSTTRCFELGDQGDFINQDFIINTHPKRRPGT